MIEPQGDERFFRYVVYARDINTSKSNLVFSDPEQVGQKAVGLSALPTKWCPPFFCITTAAFSAWEDASITHRREIVTGLGQRVVELAGAWEGMPHRGIIIRSSAVTETLRDRGMLDSQPLPADFNADRIGDAISLIFQNAEKELGDGKIALIIQRLVPGQVGHLSNERRVSKTRNHWMWEQEGGSSHSGKFNSQRASPPDEAKELSANDDKQLIQCFRSIGRWCTELRRGRVHLEWSWSGGQLWLLQLDFEDEAPDDGADPKALIRDADGVPPKSLGPNSLLNEVDFGASRTGWAKVDNLRQLAAARPDPYPPLFWLQGSSIRGPEFKRENLERDIQRATNGRAVCRTDCNSHKVERLNLPRTDSVSPIVATNFIYSTLEELEIKGARPEEICFIIHKFIPAQSAAWALATPSSQIVRVDSLWGVPDGLQYLPHDSFEYDVKRKQISSERLRFKPAFIQEQINGSWKEVKVARQFGRHRSLSQADLAEVASIAKDIANSVGAPVQIMWFCGIPDSVGIGRNLPWFLMNAPPHEKPQLEAISPQRPKVKIKNREDIENLLRNNKHDVTLVLEPDVDLIRKSDEFLERIISFSKGKNISVELHGSMLCHAFYFLARSGLTVVPSDEPRYARTRGRRVFGKLVRDSIPSNIQEHGEQVSLARIGRSEARAALLVKLMEEIQELKTATRPDEVMTELADLHEVIRSLCAATGIDWLEVERTAEVKREQRGSFKENVVLLETSWPKSERTEYAPPIQIPLKALARSKIEDHAVQLSYAALFAEGADSTVEMSNGMRLKLSLNESGLRIEEVEYTRIAEAQLELPLREKTDG